MRALSIENNTTFFRDIMLYFENFYFTMLQKTCIIDNINIKQSVKQQSNNELCKRCHYSHRNFCIYSYTEYKRLKSKLNTVFD